MRLAIALLFVGAASSASAVECDLPRLFFEQADLVQPFTVGFMSAALAVLSAVPVRMLLSWFRSL